MDMGASPRSVQDIEPPFGIILDELRSGNAIPFLGAGASRVGHEAPDPAFLPSSAELAEILADAAKFPSNDERDRTDLAKVSSYYVDGSNRGALRRKLRRVFAGVSYSCNDLHRFLADVANNLLIVTTNYDTLLEQAFLELGKPVLTLDNKLVGIVYAGTYGTCYVIAIALVLRALDVELVQ